MAKKRHDRPKRKRSPVEILMAVLGIAFIAVAVLVALILLTHGCSVVHYPGLSPEFIQEQG